MRSFSEKNYRNIQSLFTEKTGVPLRKRRVARAAPFVLAAAVLAALLTVTALAADLFSPLAGDDLALGAVYEGDGVVSVHVENRSDKELKFQGQLRLLRWDTSEEIAPKRGAAVRFANTTFAPHTEGVMTLDLSRAYDLEALDEPLAQGGYYLVLTNSNFVFGQDWICFIHAAAPEETGETAEAVPEKTPEPTAAPLAPAETDAELTARVDALFRRAGGEEVVQSGEISQPPFLLNTRNRTLEKNGQRVKLTQVEYAIMRVFMENPGKALSREEILDRVWGRDYFGELKIVDVNIRRLRLKIEDNVQNPTFITTVWGYGYKWDA